MNLEHLNPAQREAVLTGKGPVSVLAGAGSGKTRVLTHRVARLMTEGVPGDRILAITFTNKAAREMRERVLALLKHEGLGDAVPFVSTFHALGVHILRKYGSALGIKRHFTIYDRADSVRAIKSILEELGVDPKSTEPRSVLGAISKQKGGGSTLEEFLARKHESYFVQTVAYSWEKYEATLRKEQALDFDDLIVKPLHLMERDERTREALQNTWEYVHVDEFQDTNVTQAAFVNLLVKKHGNVFVVGDEDQCVYSWRQATIENLMSFKETYPGATTIILSENYRSTKAIVESANRVIEKNKNRHEKTATTSNGEGEPITLALARSERDEATFVVDEVLARQDRGVPLQDMAVLYRTNFQSRALEDEFLSRGIPYQVLGTKFFERKEVKDVLSYLRLAVTRESTADLSRVINTPPRGIGKVTLLKLVEEKPLGSAEIKVAAFFALMEEIRAQLRVATLSETIRYIIEKSGLRTLYESKTEEDRERLQNMEELATLAVRFDHLSSEEAAFALIEEAALLGEQDTMNAEGGVKLMTIHAAKGLEFRVVFVTGMEEGLFPHEKEDGEDEEEERRLFYVAMTRAKEKLYLTLAQTRRIYGTILGTVPSSFIHDLDQSRVEVVEADQGPSLLLD